MATIQRFQDLEIWQLARQLENDIFVILKEGLLAKDFSIKDQMSRSAGSIMDNIAEGFGRGGRNEFIQFLSIAKASAAELQSQLTRCLDRSYINQEVFQKLDSSTLLIGNKIGALIRHLNEAEIKGQKFLNRSELKSTINKTTQQSTPNTKHQTNKIDQETIHTNNAAKPLGAYPHARKVENLLFLSGIGSRSAVDNKIPGLELDENGNILKYDIEAETHQVMANVKAVLEASGSSWDKIVDVTVFLTNMKKDFPIYNKIYGEYFKDVEACRTTVEVKSLPTPIAIELKVIATIE
jgi:2-aminomuconate deaminase